MVDISSQNNKINVTVSSSGNTANTNVTPDTAMYYSNKSKEWAISNRIVDNTDYSSKYYANESKKQADISTAKATEVIESGNTAVSNIGSARDNAIIDVNTAGATQVALATEQATIATNKASEVVVSGNEALSNIDTAKNNAIKSITNQETTSKNVLIDEGATQVGLIQNEGAKQVANVQSTGFYMRDDKLYYINSQGEETEFKSGSSGLEICDIGMALYVDETKGLRRYLNGQIVDINTNTQAFLNRLKDITTLHPSLLCTEEEWQTAKTMSKLGQCGKFVFNYGADGITVVSVRLPAVVNINGLVDMANAGLIKDESLPNIKGTTVSGCPVADVKKITNEGAFKLTTNNITGWNGGATATANVDFDASRSSSTYKNNAPVQQEAIQYPYFIQIATGSETENNIINDIELNNPYSLFDSKYSDHELNNLSWLKSKGQWNRKAVYPSVYDELLREYNNPDRLATFNKDAFTVVGNPTITDDGVLINGDESNYVQIQNVLNPDKDYVINFSNLSATDTMTEFTIAYWFNLAYGKTYYANNWNSFVARIVTPTDTLLYTIEQITKKIDITKPFDVTYYKKDKTYSFKIQQGNKIYQSSSITADLQANPSKHINLYATGGSIDLKHFSITVDGVKVFSGAKSKVKLSTEEYTDYDFVLNTAEETFRLPLKNGQEGVFANGVKGNGIALGLTNGSQNAGLWAGSTHISLNTKAYGTNIGASGQTTSSFSDITIGLTTDPTKSGLVVDTTVPSGWNLYFYVGETVQNANLIDAGRIGEQLANKQDKCIHIIDTYVNGTSGYRIWSDGYCEQWGQGKVISSGYYMRVNFIKPFANTNYIGYGIALSSVENVDVLNYVGIQAKKVNGCTFMGSTHASAQSNMTMLWKVEGYIA